jgi:sugar/nucleoside kinase (ribokinase family)
MRRRPAILCVGIAVRDLVFRVAAFPAAGAKAQALDFIAISGGCAANAAIAAARLGASARFAGPLGGSGDPTSDAILADLVREGVDVAGAVRVDGTTAPVSGIMIDGRGERTIATHRDPRLAAARPADPESLLDGIDVMLADNRFPEFARLMCEAARARDLTVVLDADKPTRADDPLLGMASHVVFSAECLVATAQTSDLDAALSRMDAGGDAFLAVTDGANDVRWRRGGAGHRMPVLRVAAVDTLAAGDVFHAAFALALAEGRTESAALRFAAAAAGLKCTRFGGINGAPARAEVDALLAGALDGAAREDRT